jgi:heavy metal translocating P-type ATPase
MGIFDIICTIIGVAGAIWSLIGIIKGLAAKEFGLDVLALVAIISTLIVGEYIASVIVVIMTLTGDFLEDYASKQAEKELSQLISRTPEVAHLLSDTSSNDGEGVDVKDVKIGDVLVVRAGEIIPVDGTVFKGKVNVDESSLTGESVPVEKQKGDEILSGSVADALFKMVATKTAADSSYQKITELVELAKNVKPNYVKLADTISIPFTIVSFAIAGVAWAVSGEPLRFAEVLVLATPCPLLIAAPVAFLAGLSRAAKSGIIIKGGSVLERLSRVKVVAFDKTGTLTNGRPEFDRIELLSEFEQGETLHSSGTSQAPKWTQETVLQIAASIEAHSNHVLGAAIIKQNKLELLEVQEVKEAFGRGIRGDITIDGVTLRVWVQKPGHDLHIEGGETVVEVMIAGVDVAHIFLRDHLREGVAESLAGLKRLGVKRLIMLTGDRSETAQYVAAQIGIKDVRSSLLPYQKQEAVLGLKMSCALKPDCVTLSEKQADRGPGMMKNDAVAMVGDGVNDAPVLMASDVGIAFGARGSSAATQSADVVLEHDDFRLVLTSFDVSHNTMRIARQSMVGGIALSVILMGVAAFGFIPAILGAILQEVIDVIAICNGIRAKFGKSKLS